LNRVEGTNPYLVIEDLQETMNRYVNIVRTEEELAAALKELERIKKDAAVVKAAGTSQYNPGWHEALSLRPLLITAEAVTRAALVRQESRGAHTRFDFPAEREEWGKMNVIIRKGPRGMEVEKEQRPEPPKELAAIAYATLEELEGGNG
jgi:succinate dehydrogenase / fumarate reductase flavoprotein subunit